VYHLSVNIWGRALLLLQSTQPNNIMSIYKLSKKKTIAAPYRGTIGLAVLESK